MIKITTDDLRRILITCAGSMENAWLHDEILTRGFDELGYDSLALLETAARIEQEFGVHIPENQLSELSTPQELLDLANTSLQDAA